jgi:hypothetical protein
LSEQDAQLPTTLLAPNPECQLRFHSGLLDPRTTPASEHNPVELSR